MQLQPQAHHVPHELPAHSASRQPCSCSFALACAIQVVVCLVEFPQLLFCQRRLLFGEHDIRQVQLIPTTCNDEVVNELSMFGNLFHIGKIDWLTNQCVDMLSHVLK